MEVQTAAREVAKVNEQLRILLHLRGVSDSGIRQFLQTGRTTHLGGSRLSENKEAEGTSFHDFEPSANICNDNNIPLGRSHVSNQEIPEDPADTGLTVIPSSVQSWSGSTSVTETTPSPNTPTPYPTKHQFSADPSRAVHAANRCRVDPETINTTSCLDAARIIAGMRGTNDSDEVRVELGCPSATEECRMNNVAIFEAMNQ